MLLSPTTLGRAMILNLDWDNGPNALSLDAAANVATWLIERFTFDGAQDIPAAFLVAKGMDQSARIIDTGYTLHACMTDRSLNSHKPNDITGYDILGTRPLKQLLSDFVETGQVVGGTDPMRASMDIDTAKHVIALVEGLPWFRELLGLPVEEFDPLRVANSALELGMPENLLTDDSDF